MGRLEISLDGGRGVQDKGEVMRPELWSIALLSKTRNTTFSRALIAQGTREGRKEVLPPCGHFHNNNLKTGKKESRSGVDSLRPHGLYSPWNSPGQNTGVGRCSLLQGIFPNQGSNSGLPHCRLILYQLSHLASPVHTGNSSNSQGLLG